MTDVRWGRWALLLLMLLGSCTSAGERASSPTGVPTDTQGSDANPELLLPEVAHQRAPDTYRVRLETTKGTVLIEANRNWAPIGADRFYNLVRIGFFDDVAFFRAVENFMIQFGVNGDPAVNKVWSVATIPDDPLLESNLRGSLSFAQGGPNTRTTQLFINLKDNSELDDSGFVPVAHVTEGMEVVDRLYTGYGELYPKGRGPRFQLLNLQGNTYLKLHFPNMDYIRSAAIIE